MKLQRVIVLVVMVLVAGLFAQAPGKGNGHGHGGKGDGTRMAQELGLSEKQQADLKVLREKHRAERIDIRTEVKALRKEIAEELKKSTPSKSKIKTLADKIGAIHSANAVRMADHMLEVKKILTPEQFSKMLDIKEKKGNKGPNHQGKGRGPGGKKQHGHQRGSGCCPQS